MCLKTSYTARRGTYAPLAEFTAESAALSAPHAAGLCYCNDRGIKIAHIAGINEFISRQACCSGSANVHLMLTFILDSASGLLVLSVPPWFQALRVESLHAFSRLAVQMLWTPLRGITFCGKIKGKGLKKKKVIIKILRFF